jgi:hypothetical protein
VGKLNSRVIIIARSVTTRPSYVLSWVVGDTWTTIATTTTTAITKVIE